MPDGPDGLRHINITYQIEIRAGNLLYIPGCEPSSAISSDVLARALDCGAAVAHLNDVMAAIPGCTIKFLQDGGHLGYIRKFLVFPPVNVSCPCRVYPDYYAILRSLAKDEPPVTEEFDACDMVGMDLCPSPDFRSIPAPDPSPYFPEGTSPFGPTSYLNFPVEWNGGGAAQY